MSSSSKPAFTTMAARSPQVPYRASTSLHEGQLIGVLSRTTRDPKNKIANRELIETNDERDTFVFPIGTCTLRSIITSSLSSVSMIALESHEARSHVAKQIARTDYVQVCERRKSLHCRY